MIISIRDHYPPPADIQNEHHSGPRGQILSYHDNDIKLQNFCSCAEKFALK